MSLRVAEAKDLAAVCDFYDTLIDAIRYSPFFPKWEKDVHPSHAFLRDAIASGEVILYEEADGIAASMVLDQTYEKGVEAQWSISATDEECLVIHVLGVRADLSGQGIGARMVQAAIDLARDRHLKAVRLDVLEGNSPAEALYTKMGFRRCDTRRFFYENSEWLTFHLYDYLC